MRLECVLDRYEAAIVLAMSKQLVAGKQLAMESTQEVSWPFFKGEDIQGVGSERDMT